MKPFSRSGVALLAALGLSASVSAADNMILNGDFADAGASWSLSKATGNTATVAYASGAAVVSITETDPASNWGVQLVQKGLLLEAGSSYTVTFKASASAARTINVAMSTDKTWHYQGGGDVALSTAAKTFTVKIVPDSTVDAGILQFNLGGDTAAVTIDDVVVTGGSSTVTAGSEMILNGDFAGGGTSWGLSKATGNTATVDYATEAAVVSITETDPASNWGVQLVQKGLKLESGSSYLVTFNASASAARTINVAMSTDKTWHYQGGGDVSLTTAKKAFSVKITPDSTVDAGILQFNLGGDTATVTIDDVSVKQQIVSGGLKLLPDTTTVPPAPSDLPGLRVNGRFLTAPTGEKIVYRGINEMFVWGDTQGATLAEIAKSGANSVRIVWLSTSPAAGLDTLVSRAIRAKLLPVVEFHDATGKWESLPTLVKAWRTKAYLDMIQRHEKYLVVNIGNEVGDGSVSLAEYVAGYDSSVAQLRRSGVRVPLMIDAPNYGSNYSMMAAASKTLLMQDSLRNLLFSVHMWWPIKNNTDKATTVARIKSSVADAVAKNIPMVVGEFGEAFTSTLATTAVAEADSIPFRTIMDECQKNQIGWMAWSWGKVDNNPQIDLNMTTDGTFAGLQTWGLEVAVTDPNSIKNTSVISTYVANGATSGNWASSVRREPAVSGWSVRFGARDAFVQAPAAGEAEWIAASGAVLSAGRLRAGENRLALPAARGVWILRTAGGSWKVATP